MKLPLLLTRFLYQNKKLNLPGIGSFTLDPATIIPDDPEKNPHETIQGLEFQYIPIHKADDDLIDFIRLHTGKIKPLAESDLESYLTLGIQLLNIGKPFYFEGIGAIIKNQEGRYEFTPGEYSMLKMDEPETEKAERKEKTEKRKSVFDEQHDEYEPQSNVLRKFLLVTALLGGLVLIGWGGYSLYKKNTYPETLSTTSTATEIVKDTTASQTDTTALTGTASQVVVVKADTPQVIKKPEVIKPVVYSKDSVLYKFVILATDKKSKALKRYEQLLSYQLRVKMDTKDSTFFKVYFAFPSVAKDTAHIKDSLNLVYGTKVFLER